MRQMPKSALSSPCSGGFPRWASALLQIELSGGGGGGDLLGPVESGQSRIGKVGAASPSLNSDLLTVHQPAFLFPFSFRNFPSAGEQGHRLSQWWEKLHFCPWPWVHLGACVRAAATQGTPCQCSPVLSPPSLLPCCLHTNSSRKNATVFFCRYLDI